jgi:hypothetical protein
MFRKMYANSSAVRSLEPAAHAAIAVRPPTIALTLFAVAITLWIKHTDIVVLQRQRRSAHPPEVGSGIHWPARVGRFIHEHSAFQRRGMDRWKVGR